MVFRPPDGEKAQWKKVYEYLFGKEERWNGDIILHSELLEVLGTDNPLVLHGVIRRVVKEMKEYQSATLESVYGFGYRIVQTNETHSHQIHHAQRKRFREWGYRNYPKFHVPWEISSDEWRSVGLYFIYEEEMMNGFEDFVDLLESGMDSHEERSRWMRRQIFKRVRKEYRCGIVRSIRSGGTPKSLFGSLLGSQSIARQSLETGDWWGWIPSTECQPPGD